ncbi:MAG: hypothetical protein ABSA93_08290 [Streptosporangiaceae bacterium]|jgi:hypothetical protein
MMVTLVTIWRDLEDVGVVRRKARGPDPYSDAALYLCLNAADLRLELGDERWDPLSQAFLAAEPSTAAWREAIRALHDAATAVGIPGGLGLEVTMGRGFPEGPAPRSSGWVCPTRSCPRVELRDDSPTAPCCWMSGQPLRLVE